MGRKRNEELIEELKDVEVEITEKEFKLARSIARRYNLTVDSRISSEDIEQDILYRYVYVKKEIKYRTGEEPEENLAYAKSIMENKARDLYRTNKREKERYVTVDMNSASQESEGPEQAEVVLERMGVNIESFEDLKYSDYEVMELITKFMKNEVDNRVKYVVIAMGYVNSGLSFLEGAYKELLGTLSEEEKENLDRMLDENKGYMTNDISYKIFGKLKTGVNSGSAWKIRDGLNRFKRILRGEKVEDIYSNAKEA